MERPRPEHTPEPRFYRQSMGTYELYSISDGGLNYPAEMILGNVPPEDATQRNLPQTQLFVPYTVLLIKTPDALLLHDVGAGDFGNQGDSVFPGLDHATSRTNLVVPSLKAAGFEPVDIDAVLITHAHPDHVGGLLDPEGRLQFPNAQYYVAQQEWEYWTSADPSTVEAEALRHHLELLVRAARRAFDAIAGRITPVQVGQEILPGIRVEATYGHTPGHVMASVSAGDQTLYNISDMVVHPLFVEEPDWAPAIDMDAALADQTRRRFYAQAASEGALVFAHHLGPFPNLGRIVPRGDGWQWQPVEAAG